MPEIKTINDKTEWNNFLLSQPTQTGIFLQSAEWLDFQEIVGHKTWRLASVGEQKNISALCGLIEKNIKFGRKYFYLPRGPIEKRELGNKDRELLVEKIVDIAKKENAIFLRLEPAAKLQVTRYKLQEVSHVQPEHTLVLDLAKSEDELLSEMHEKTRYNIRLSEKKNLTLKDGNFKDFWKLMEETTKRDKFSAHSEKYYETMLREIRGNGKSEMKTELKMVYFENRPVAAAIIGYFGDTATYLHGASSHEYRNLMAPYLLHWEIIKEAKKIGYKYYDFWGIDEKKWPGVTRFKKGFGGFEINYPGAFDLSTSKFWYKLYNLAKKFYKPS